MIFQPYIARDRFFRDWRFDFYIANETGRSWYDGSPNQHMIERDWCIDRIRPGSTVVDCGAHHGMMTVLFSKAVGPQGRVIAYEVLPENASVIRQNAVLNRCDNVTVRPVGIGAAPGSLTVTENASNTVVLGDAASGERIVEIVRLDDDLPAALNIDFIKVDVEGHDLEALQGMPRILAQRPVLDLEIHNFLFFDRAATLAAISTILEPIGYRFQIMPTIAEQPSMPLSRLDISYLARFDNPHVLCTP